MNDVTLTLIRNSLIGKNTYRMVLEGIFEEAPRPGQFVNLSLPGFYLRRPISVCDFEWLSIKETAKSGKGRLTLIYKAVGAGTEEMSRMQPGEKLSALAFLGNGYDLSVAGERPLLIGGGVGVPPLYLLAKELLAEDRQVTVILGFGSKDEVFYEEEFRKLGCRTIVTTLDGSCGIKGFVTDALQGCEDTASAYSHFFTCGPEPMLKAVYRSLPILGQFSFEERMGCGFGACMGCSCRTITGYKRICKDGPVLRKEEILWDA